MELSRSLGLNKIIHLIEFIMKNINRDNSCKFIKISLQNKFYCFFIIKIGGLAKALIIPTSKLPE